MTAAADPRVAFVQDGARLHYAFPLALQQHGMLERVFTTWYTAPGSPEALIAKAIRPFAPALADRIAGRIHAELDARRVFSNRWLVLRQRWMRRHSRSLEEHYQRCAELERRWIERLGWGQATVFGGFVRNVAPGLCRAARQAGLRVVVDQMIAPAAIEQREATEQRRRFPGWEPPVDYSIVAADEEATWREADRITCSSEYVQGGLTAMGVPAERVALNPYPIAAPEFQFVDRSNRTGQPTVGFIGQVGLRKGAPYFLDVARRLANRARFVMVGPVAISADVLSRYADNAELIGSVPRSHVRHWLERFDVFFFPSTCEGSPSSVVEAMLTGLPIVTTPTSGTMVRHEIDGFIAPYDDVVRLTESIGRLIDDRNLRSAMGVRARERALEFDVARFGDRLAAIVRAVMANR